MAETPYILTPEYVVQEAINAWRIATDPASHDGPTMAEAIVAALREARLIDGSGAGGSMEP